VEDILFNKNFTCVAVSKTKPKEDIEKIYNLGHRDFGENKVQELEYKYNNLPQDINWHMIGHLQSNKVRKVIPIVSLIHSVDSLKLLKVINKESKKFDKVTNCLIQVNISKESSKYGFKESELGFLNQESMSEYQNIKFKGLMGMASFTDSESIIKNEFNNLKNIYNNIRKEIDDFNILSMGMSNDYKIAIESGSNMIRVGSKIFGKRNYQ
tara:strand:- start:1021 stop:1653 length:633 start_codon:yes stop_codon:yes gene_type:complete